MPVMAVLFGIMACLGVVQGAETVTIRGKIEKVDLFERTISVADPASKKSIALELTRKTKIISKALAVGADSIKPGDDAIVKYNSNLMVASSIEFGPRLEILNLEELNSPYKDFAPYVSADGLEIFWSSETVGRKSIYSIWSARRKMPQTLFSDKKQLFSGQCPVLSSNGLEMLFRDSDSDAISLSTRKSRDEDFGRPSVVSSLSFPHLDPTPSWLTEDGLTLYLDLAKVNSKDAKECWVATRESVTSHWNSPTRVEVSFEGIPNGFSICSATSTPDQLHLFCVSNHSIGVVSRAEPVGPFTQWDEIHLTAPNGNPVLCFKQQYVAATQELFLTSNNLYADPATKRKRWGDLWVIKDFQPPFGVRLK